MKKATEWKVETLPDGQKNLALLKRGKWHYLYSKNDPAASGERFYTSVYNGQGLYIIIGLGYYYHLLPFVHNDNSSRIIVIEPSKDLFDKVKYSHHYSNLERSKRIQFIIGSEEIKDFIERLRGNYELLFYDRLNLLSYPILDRLLPETYSKLKDDINRSLMDLLRDGLTIARFAKRWLLNFKNNLENILDSYSLTSLKRFRGSCIVAAAGPSLDRVIDRLKTLDRTSYFIIAVDAAVRPLMLSGIMPDLIISIDPQPFIRFHFFDVEKFLKKIPAILNPMVYSAVFELFDVRYTYPTRHPLFKMLKSLNTLDSKSFNYQSVSSLAVSVANFLGFKSIYLAGFDYSYSGFRSYAIESFYYRYIFINSSRINTFFTQDVGFVFKKVKEHGLKLTSEELLNYKQELEELIARLKNIEEDLKFYNLFSEGFEIDGTERCNNLPERFNYDCIKEAPKIKTDIDINLKEEDESLIIKPLVLYYRLIKGLKIEEAHKKAKKFWYYIFSLIKSKIKWPR